MWNCNFLLWLLFPALLHGYFLDEDATWKQPGNIYQTPNFGYCKTFVEGSNINLFGWSMKHFKGELYVGAPLETDERGGLYKCTNLKTSPTCEKVWEKKESESIL